MKPDTGSHVVRVVNHDIFWCFSEVKRKKKSSKKKKNQPVVILKTGSFRKPKKTENEIKDFDPVSLSLTLSPFSYLTSFPPHLLADPILLLSFAAQTKTSTEVKS